MTLLEVRDLHARYGQVHVLHGVDLDVDEGEVAVVLGANGAGKTTTLRALTGLVHRHGSVRFDGDELVGATTEQIVRRGIAHVPQGRGTVSELTVEENLEVGAYVRRDRVAVRRDLQRVVELFPRLRERRGQSAGSLSGGEQQMLAIGRAMMLAPRLMLLDEPSLGLAPIIVRELFATLRDINAELGTTMLVVEQNASLAMRVAHRAFVLETGRVVLHGDAASVQADDSIRKAYLGY